MFFDGTITDRALALPSTSALSGCSYSAQNRFGIAVDPSTNFLGFVRPTLVIETRDPLTGVVLSNVRDRMRQQAPRQCIKNRTTIAGFNDICNQQLHESECVSS